METTETDLAAQAERAGQYLAEREQARQRQREEALKVAAREEYKPWVFELAVLHGLEPRVIVAICAAAFAAEADARGAEMLGHSRTLAEHVVRQTAAVESIARSLGGYIAAAKGG